MKRLGTGNECFASFVNIFFAILISDINYSVLYHLKFQFCYQYEKTFVPSVVKSSRVLEIQAYMLLKLLMSIVVCRKNFIVVGIKLLSHSEYLHVTNEMSKAKYEVLTNSSSYGTH
jgi:hypothetical protein